MDIYNYGEKKCVIEKWEDTESCQADQCAEATINKNNQL